MAGHVGQCEVPPPVLERDAIRAIAVAGYELAERIVEQLLLGCRKPAGTGGAADARPSRWLRRLAG